MLIDSSKDAGSQLKEMTGNVHSGALFLVAHLICCIGDKRSPLNMPLIPAPVDFTSFVSEAEAGWSSTYIRTRWYWQVGGEKSDKEVKWTMAIKLGARSPKCSELRTPSRDCSPKAAVTWAGIQVCVSVGRPSSRIKFSLTLLIHE